ncbi:MAG: oxidoreductase [Chitinophagaceae bacterium]|nr:oxidoreductase [Chitinophagaceae bacterium]
MIIRLILACVLFSGTAYTQAPGVPVVNLIYSSSPRQNFRGLSVPSDNVVWVSGQGLVLRSVNGGQSFDSFPVPGYERTEFRDIEAFNATDAIILGVDRPGILLQTHDGGKSWQKIYEDTAKGVFLDAMTFNNKGRGLAVGDPINGHGYFVGIDAKQGFAMKINLDISFNEGEAFFASSGTNVQFTKPSKNKLDKVVFVTGGKSSRFYDEEWKNLPLIQGKESTGANSIDIWNKRNMVVVGGDFTTDKIATGNCAYSTNKGETWHQSLQPPHGYRSCVTYLSEKQLIACGTSGMDYSNDGGKTWQLISNESYNVVQKSNKGNAVYLAGAKGKIAKVQVGNFFRRKN